MKKPLIALTLLLASLYCQAPEWRTLPILLPEPQHRYTSCPLERAFIRLESRFDAYAVNRHTGATGLLQIMPVMVDEANRVARLLGLKRRYTMYDALRPEVSLEMFRIVMLWHDPPDMEEMVKIWFGRGVQHDGWTWREYHERLITFIN